MVRKSRVPPSAPSCPSLTTSPDIVLAEGDAFDFAVAEEIFELAIGNAVDGLSQEDILDEDHQQQCDDEIAQREAGAHGHFFAGSTLPALKA